MTVYIARYYDWVEYEYGETVNVCTSFTDVVAWLFDEYAGRFNSALVQDPVKWRDEERWIQYIEIPIDEGEHGNCITIERTEVT